MNGNFGVWRRDNVNVSVFADVSLTQNEKVRSLPSKVHVRVQHDDNKIVSVGFENTDVLNSHKPDVLSAWGLFGGNLPNGFKGFAGAYTGFQLSSNSLLFHKYLLGLKHKDLTGHLEAGINRVNNKSKVKDETTGVETEVDSTVMQKSVNLRVDGNLCRSWKLGADLAYNFDTTNLDAKVQGIYTLDSDTYLKVKAQSDNSLTLGLVHNYKGLINFNFVSKVNFIF
jgi:hypothetical protein